MADPFPNCRTKASCFLTCFLIPLSPWMRIEFLGEVARKFLHWKPEWQPSRLKKPQKNAKRRALRALIGPLAIVSWQLWQPWKWESFINVDERCQCEIFRFEIGMPSQTSTVAVGWGWGMLAPWHDDLGSWFPRMLPSYVVFETWLKIYSPEKSEYLVFCIKIIRSCLIWYNLFLDKTTYDLSEDFKCSDLLHIHQSSHMRSRFYKDNGDDCDDGDPEVLWMPLRTGLLWSL